ncbi:MAG: hypothetical protein EB154_09625 [Nitrosopumilaceae archaeon]|nr:hypothetical protein [Nitrosopumilaceae archaeon]
MYTYRVPNVLFEDVAVGKRVIVQFGKTRVYSALVQSIHNQPPAEYEAKYINSVLDESPLISQEQLNFWQWMSEYYMCSLGDVMSAALPAPFKLASESTIILNPEFDKNSIDYLEIKSPKGSILTKLVCLIYMLDYASVYCAVLNKTDPSPVKSIDFVKKRL